MFAFLTFPFCSNVIMICARFNLNLTMIFQVKYWLFYRFPQIQPIFKTLVGLQDSDHIAPVSLICTNESACHNDAVHGNQLYFTSQNPPFSPLSILVQLC